MLNTLHTHAAFAVGSWMQALNFGILPEGRKKKKQANVKEFLHNLNPLG